MNWQIDNQPGLVSAWHLNGNFLDGTGSNHGTQVGSVSFGPSGVALGSGTRRSSRLRVRVVGHRCIQGDGFAPRRRSEDVHVLRAGDGDSQSAKPRTRDSHGMLRSRSVPRCPASMRPVHAGGEAVNVNFADPTLTFLYGLTLVAPFANVSIPLSFSSIST